MLEEFKKFAIRGNVIDMAVGVVMGTAFGKIVSSLVADVIMPPIGLLIGGIDFSRMSLTLRAATETQEALTLNYGLFLNTVIDFVIIAAAIFLFIKQINRFHSKKEAPKKAEPSEEVMLLREIRDALKRKTHEK